jgi:hypothetical protein
VRSWARGRDRSQPIWQPGVVFSSSMVLELPLSMEYYSRVAEVRQTAEDGTHR